MSIKVYRAFRLAEGVDPFDLLWELKQQGQLEAKKRLTKLFQDILEGRSQAAHQKHVDQTKLFTAWIKGRHEPGEKVNVLSLYRKWVKEECPPELRVPHEVVSVSNKEIFESAKREDKTEEDLPSLLDIDSWALNQYGKTLAQIEWDVWALDAALTLRRFEERYYLIPYCDQRCYLGGLFDFLDKDDRLEEYGYWNNTDKPDTVTEDDWEERSRIWDYLTEHKVWSNFVEVDVVSWRGWNQVSPAFDLLRDLRGEDLERHLS